MSKKPGFMLYHELWKPLFKNLTMEERGQMITAMFEYSESDVVPDFGDNRILSIVWETARTAIDKDTETYNERVARSKKAANARWNNQEESVSDFHANVCSSIPEHAQAYPSIPKHTQAMLTNACDANNNKQTTTNNLQYTNTKTTNKLTNKQNSLNKSNFKNKETEFVGSLVGGDSFSENEFERELEKISKSFSDFSVDFYEPKVRWYLEKGMESLVISTAAMEAAERKRTDWKYVQGILSNWYDAGVKTVDQLDTYNQEFSRQFKPENVVNFPKKPEYKPSSDIYIPKDVMERLQAEDAANALTDTGQN